MMKHTVMTYEQFSTRPDGRAVNEGAGAGYDVMIGGLMIDKNTVKVDVNDTVRYVPDTDSVRWSAKLLPSDMTEWATASYYDSIDSENIDWESYKIKGGEVRGFWSVGEDMMRNGAPDENAIMAGIKEEIDNVGQFTLSQMFGGGWSHSNLDNPIEMGDVNAKGDWDDLIKKDHRINYDRGSNDYGIYYASIDAPEFVEMVNDFYDDPEQYYE